MENYVGYMMATANKNCDLISIRTEFTGRSKQSLSSRWTPEQQHCALYCLRPIQNAFAIFLLPPQSTAISAAARSNLFLTNIVAHQITKSWQSNFSLPPMLYLRRENFSWFFYVYQAWLATLCAFLIMTLYSEEIGWRLTQPLLPPWWYEAGARKRPNQIVLYLC